MHQLTSDQHCNPEKQRPTARLGSFNPHSFYDTVVELWANVQQIKSTSSFRWKNCKNSPRLINC